MRRRMRKRKTRINTKQNKNKKTKKILTYLHFENGKVKTKY